VSPDGRVAILGRLWGGPDEIGELLRQATLADYEVNILCDTEASPSYVRVTVSVSGKAGGANMEALSEHSEILRTIYNSTLGIIAKIEQHPQIDVTLPAGILQINNNLSAEEAEAIKRRLNTQMDNQIIYGDHSFGYHIAPDHDEHIHVSVDRSFVDSLIRDEPETSRQRRQRERRERKEAANYIDAVEK
jgi:hypothetical protein